MLIVMKFGGSSLGDAKALKNVLSLVSEYSRANDLVIVASAMNGVTNSLIKAATRASQRDENHVAEVIEELRIRHQKVCQQTIRNPDEAKRTMERIEFELKGLEKALTGISYLGELTPRSQDYVLSFGERLSTLVLTGALQDSGIKAERLTGEEAGMVTDASFGDAMPLMEITHARLNERLHPLIKNDKIPIITGYIAATKDGVTTTLGRGASDYTATIVGSAIGADEVWIWTDVDGIMTADPKIERAAKTIREISFMEAIEMSHFGAKAMHPRSLEPAAKAGLPVRVKNTFNPSGPDTLILQNQHVKSVHIVKAVTSVRQASMVTVNGAGMHGAPGTAARVLNALGKGDINVLMISQSSSEADISMVVARQDLERAIGALRESLPKEGFFRDITSEAEVSIVAAVGAGMKGAPGIAARLFRAVADKGVNVKMIAQGSSELNISFVIREDDLPDSVHTLHEEFQLGH